MRLHIEQINKKCISFLSSDSLFLQPCELGDEKAFSNLENPMEITMIIDNDGFLTETGRSPLDRVREKRKNSL